MPSPLVIEDRRSAPREDPRRGSVNRDRILEAASHLVASGDLSALTCAALARMLHIRPPSLYKHFASLETVRDGLSTRALKALTELARAAISGRSARDALEGLADAQRVYAHVHPGLYELAVRGSRVESSESRKALAAFQDVEVAALRAYALSPDDTLRMARCLRSAIWGFISLELHDGAAKSPEADQSFDRLIDILDSGARLTLKAQTIGLKLARSQ